jgi:tetratricopeptide (TPR) repeat protein
LSEAHTYSGELKWDKDRDFAGAESEFKRGIDLNPNSSAAHRMYALMLGLLGRTDEAVSEIKSAIELEPASVLNHRIFALIMYFGRRYDDAIAEGKLAVEMEPNSRGIPAEIADSYLRKGDEGQAFDWFLQSRIRVGDPKAEIEKWKKAYADSGWRGLRERQIYLFTEAENKIETQPTALLAPMAVARLYAQLGDHERAFDFIEKSFAAHQWGIVRLKTDPDLDPLRADPRFDELLRRANMK